MRNAPTRSRWIALASITFGLVIAACGSSGNPSTSASSSSSQGLKFSQCMRAHGVSNFPDPSGHGQIAIGASSGINPQSPAFQSAQKACIKFAPAKLGPPHMSASDRRAAVRFAACMRANGQSNFPDPTDTAPSGASRVFVLRGMVFAPGPGIDPKSPAFRQAAARCGVTLPSGDRARPLGAPPP